MKKFSDDVGEARTKVSLKLIPGLASIKSVEDGEGVMMTFKHENLPGQAQVKAMLTGGRHHRTRHAWGFPVSIIGL